MTSCKIMMMFLKHNIIPLKLVFVTSGTLESAVGGCGAQTWGKVRGWLWAGVSSGRAWVPVAAHRPWDCPRLFGHPLGGQGCVHQHWGSPHSQEGNVAHSPLQPARVSHCSTTNNLSCWFQNRWKGKQSLFTKCCAKQVRTSAVVSLEEGSSPSLANDHRIWTRKEGGKNLMAFWHLHSPSCHQIVKWETVTQDLFLSQIRRVLEPIDLFI